MAQPKSTDMACIVTVGEIAYPAYEWGFGSTGNARVRISLGSDGRPVLPEAPVRPSEFLREATRSLVASTFDPACQGRELNVNFRFSFAGESSDSREVRVSKEPGSIMVIAAPPVPLCRSEAHTDHEAKAHAGRADALLDGRKYAEALACADKSLAWKRDENAYIAKGVALRKLGRLQDAIAAYDELEKIAPNHHQLYFNRANAYRDLGDKEAAIRDFTKAVDLMDEPQRAYLNRGNVYVSLNRLELARNDYQRAAELDPTDATPQNSLCNILYQIGTHEQALAACNRAIELEPQSPSAYTNRAIIWIAQKKYDAAIHDASTAIRLEPRDFASYMTRSEAYALADKVSGALTDITEAIRLRPESGEAHAIRAQLRRALGDVTGAKTDERAAAQLGLTPGMTTFVFDPVTGKSKPIK